ncbi:probable E3 SUMO-protein ligase RNF212 isoform X2 [Nothobranchius furzeri]|uniref:Transcript variant X3 n=1 Tax=Nothobranchius furzeri TaxID=105023 RepID=A0A9D2YX91_NOTFU|nr:probable E3 SUMO-protein ligase RNF212 isoform X2 [Nothobranchius furzeri]KAF7228570.1 transcript variant X3 [Nothobranchius furzeri]KAF7228572.1 transcript variant X4 [Nothobranchius furzeri]
MSFWICCNSCFSSPSADHKLAVSTCGHVICNVCYQKGKQGICLICSTQCQVSPLCEKSSSDVKALFSEFSTLASKNSTEINKVIAFQARHQKRLLSYYQQRNEKLEETCVQMKQEMQRMTNKLNEQRAYIAKLEDSLQQQCAKSSSVSKISLHPRTPQGQMSVQIPFDSPVPLSRHLPASNIESMEVDERSLFRKPNSAGRLSIIKPPMGRMDTTSHRSSSQNLSTTHSAQSATISRFQGTPLTSELSNTQSSVWRSPIFKPPSTFRHSMPSMVFPPP